jgi:hypothetical protein
VNTNEHSLPDTLWEYLTECLRASAAALSSGTDDYFRFSTDQGDGTVLRELVSVTDNHVRSWTVRGNEIVESAFARVQGNLLTVINMPSGEHAEEAHTHDMGAPVSIMVGPIAVIVGNFRTVLDSGISDGGQIRSWVEQGNGVTRLVAAVADPTRTNRTLVQTELSVRGNTVAGSVKRFNETGEEASRLESVIYPASEAPWVSYGDFPAVRARQLALLVSDVHAIRSSLPTGGADAVQVSPHAKHRVFYSSENNNQFVIASVCVYLDTVFVSTSDSDEVSFREFLMEGRAGLPTVCPIPGFDVEGPTIRGAYA